MPDQPASSASRVAHTSFPPSISGPLSSGFDTKPAGDLAASGSEPFSPAMRRLFTCLLLLLLASVTFLHYREYNAELDAHPKTYSLLLQGNGAAPAQYRVGMVFAAEGLHRLTPVPVQGFIALFDFALALGAALLVQDLLSRMRGFRAASAASRWSRCLLFLLLLSFYLLWSGYYQRPETFACTFFVAASVYLLSWKRPAAVVVPCLLALAVLQGFVRADVASCSTSACWCICSRSAAEAFLFHGPFCSSPASLAQRCRRPSCTC